MLLSDQKAETVKTRWWFILGCSALPAESSVLNYRYRKQTKPQDLRGCWQQEQLGRSSGQPRAVPFAAQTQSLTSGPRSVAGGLLRPATPQPPEPGVPARVSLPRGEGKVWSSSP